jgi:hypothetical protein
MINPRTMLCKNRVTTPKRSARAPQAFSRSLMTTFLALGRIQR